jgi:creatinine amidohydrolase
MKFHEMTSAQIAAANRDQTLLILPIAAVEQHGPHLPTGTDTIICDAIANAVEARAPETIILLPTLWLGASAHHLRFGATLDADLDIYIKLLQEIVRQPLLDGFSRLMLLNGHGGNIDPLRVALRQLQTDFPDALLTGAPYWSMAEEDIANAMDGADKSVGHACEFETSMIMHLRPELVDTDKLADQSGWLPDVLDGLFICRDLKQRTKAGATGRPDLATPEKGAALFKAIVNRIGAVAEKLLAEPLVTIHDQA